MSNGFVARRSEPKIAAKKSSLFTKGIWKMNEAKKYEVTKNNEMNTPNTDFDLSLINEGKRNERKGGTLPL